MHLSLRNNRLIFTLAVVTIVTEAIIAFTQYYQTPIDGDLVPIVLPTQNYSLVLHDPLGIKAVFKGEKYAGAGRWFCHATMYFWFRRVYFLIARIAPNRIQALFLAVAIFQWCCHWLMAIVLSAYSCIARQFSWKTFIIALALTTPFFQYYHGYTNDEIIDRSVSYTAFYAFPLALLLIFFYPFFRSLFYTQSVCLSKSSFWIFFAMGPFLIFSGPLIPVIGIMTALLLLILLYNKHQPHSRKIRFGNNISRLPKTVYLLVLMMLLWLYAFYVGTFNIENETTVSVFQRYGIMMRVFFPYYFQYGLPYIYALLAVNIYFMKRFCGKILNSQNINFIKIIGIFILIYLLLLPLGGYRQYRPNILRYDITMPFTIFLIIVNISSILIVSYSVLSKKVEYTYKAIVLFILFAFWYQNLPIKDNTVYQKEIMQSLANSNSDTTVCLPFSSNFLAWQKISDTSQASSIKEMLYVWGITQRPIPFYQK